MKKTKVTVAVALLVQAVTLFVLFILQAARRRSLAQAFLAVSAFTAAGGGYLIWQTREEAREEKEALRLAREAEEGAPYEIPVDATATEKEFE